MLYLYAGTSPCLRVLSDSLEIYNINLMLIWFMAGLGRCLEDEKSLPFLIIVLSALGYLPLASTATSRYFRQMHPSLIEKIQRIPIIMECREAHPQELSCTQGADPLGPVPNFFLLALV